MFWGNIAAMLQDNVKRMLAYSSIAHAGYILVGLIAAGGAARTRAIAAVVFYLLAYAFMNLGAFGLVLYLQSEGSAGDPWKTSTGSSAGGPPGRAHDLLPPLPGRASRPSPGSWAS